ADQVTSQFRPLCWVQRRVVQYFWIRIEVRQKLPYTARKIRKVDCVPKTAFVGSFSESALRAASNGTIQGQLDHEQVFVACAAPDIRKATQRAEFVRPRQKCRE